MLVILLRNRIAHRSPRLAKLSIAARCRNKFRLACINRNFRFSSPQPLTIWGYSGIEGANPEVALSALVLTSFREFGTMTGDQLPCTLLHPRVGAHYGSGTMLAMIE